LTVLYGFVEISDLPSTLRTAKDLGCPVDLDNAVYFADTTKSSVASRGKLLRLRLPPFAFLFPNSVRAVDLFNLPPPNFVEIGRQIEIAPRTSPVTVMFLLAISPGGIRSVQGERQAGLRPSPR
jgi:KUP system potassium uptake protein